MSCSSYSTCSYTFWVKGGIGIAQQTEMPNLFLPFEEQVVVKIYEEANKLNFGFSRRIWHLE